MARTLLTIKTQIKLSLDDVKVKPNPHNHNEVQIYIKDKFVGYGADVSELVRDSKLKYNDKHPAHSVGCFKIDILGPTIHDTCEGVLLILSDERAYLLDKDVQRNLGLGVLDFNMKMIFNKETLFVLIIVLSGFAGIYYRDVVAVQKKQLEQCVNVPVK